MTFDPQTHRLLCEYCGTSAALPSQKRIVKQDPGHDLFTSPLYQKRRENLSVTESAGSAQQQTALHCQSCGSAIASRVSSAAQSCPFCGSMQFTSDTAIAIVIPDGVVSPQYDRAKAETKIRSWLCSRPLTEKRVTQGKFRLALHQVFVPVWVFAGELTASYKVSTVGTETTSSSFEKMPLSFQEEVVSSTPSLESRWAGILLPKIALDQVVPYSLTMVEDGSIVCSEISLREAFSHLQQTLGGRIIGAVKHAEAKLNQEVALLQADYEQVSYRQILCPVWLANYEIKGRAFKVVLNASTGELAGSYPDVSGKRGFLYIALFAGAVLLLAIAVYVFQGNRDRALSNGTSSSDQSTPANTTPEPLEVKPEQETLPQTTKKTPRQLHKKGKPAVAN